MIYFLLPNVNITIYKQIDCVFSPIPPDVTISNSLSHYLFEIKNKIKQYENDWNDYKKYTNPYEFINTIIPGKNKCVSKYKPLSRSYFKMVEILNFLVYNLREPNYNIVSDISNTKNYNTTLSNNISIRINKDKVVTYNSNIVNQNEDYTNLKSINNIYIEDIEEGEIFNFSINLKQSSPIRTFHLAEGPGGFIEAIVNLRNNSLDQYYGMTILDDAENCKIYSLPEIQEKGMNVPGWKKTESFLRSHPNVILEHGIDKTGNILSLENFLYCRTKYGSSMDFITADGGFDFSVDFNNQEMNISALLFAQVCYAICLQKKGGHFVLKIFDCFMDNTVDILYILSSFYEKVYITKPQTSRYANSEKYMVCKNFLVDNDTAVFPFLKDAFQKMLISQESGDLYIHRFLKIPVSIYYIYRLEEYNAIFGQQQIENIYQTIILIENSGNQRFNRNNNSRNGLLKYTKKINSVKDDNNFTEELNTCKTNQKWSREYVGDNEKNNIDGTFYIESYGDSSLSTGSFCNRGKNLIHPKIENLIRSNIQKCIQWCIKHNIAYYNYND